MYVYEVTLSSGRTDTVQVLADSVLDVQSIYENLSDAYVTNIKKIVYVNQSPQLANTSFFRELKIVIGNGFTNAFVRVRFAKNILDKNRIIQLCKTHLMLNNKKVSEVHGVTTWN